MNTMTNDEFKRGNTLKHKKRKTQGALGTNLSYNYV